MDKLKSLELEKQIKGQSIGGFKVLKLINNGKSAAVFKAEKNDIFYALKIFDNDLVERFGHEIQTKRIEQEIALKNHSIPNLVRIFEGGNTDLNGQKYYFLVMELISGSNLKDYIVSNEYGQNFAIKVLEKLTETTEQLLSQKGIAHRDIKPENIMVSEENKIILMDLGVLKLVGAKSFSDEEEKSFVGTLRYAPPEFLLRTETDSEEGWRAINLYQIGATLHDIIMKKELFYDKTPYSNLVIAIKEDVPQISNTTFSFELLQLTRDMMTKDWKKRLNLSSTQRINLVINSKLSKEDAFEESIEEILKMRIGHQANFDEIEKLQRTKSELLKKRKDFAIKLFQTLDECVLEIKEKGVFTDFKKSKHFRFSNDRNGEKQIQNYLYEFHGDLKMGFPSNLYLFFRIINTEDYYTEIETFSTFPSVFAKANVNNPESLFRELDKTSRQLKNMINRVGPPAINYNFKTINIFKGIAEIDSSLKNQLKIQIVKLIMKSLKAVEKKVENKIEEQKRMVESKRSVNFNVSTSGGNNIVIDSL
ncbi:protein kinase domain-containing protein [Flavivirga spongiicola]|uniref:Protein kinase n=1 Tax=Flavivirga spongiicola TaxID=421621 RepID=A0ABU7XLH3_9FLAO|nr:protein kinase [Flavivirga sp. MEBiC05379]MDO5981269.1 protein kinase [Flavivirga sp. MEBiC05379]